MAAWATREERSLSLSIGSPTVSSELPTRSVGVRIEERTSQTSTAPNASDSAESAPGATLARHHRAYQSSCSRASCQDSPQ